MKWATMSSRDRRAVLLGVGILLPGLLFIWGVRPYQAALSDARDQLATERATLARERAAIATARRNPQLQHVADSAMRAMRPRLFEGKDDVMASAELGSYLGDVARKARVWLQAANTRPAVSSAEGVRTLRVEIRAESDLRGTLMFLQALERGDKLIRIDRLDISRTLHSDEKEGETLSIAATIAGFAVGDSVTTTSVKQPAVATVQANSGGLP
jgi:Type II secretion system (T2SS), protein M subtype b